MRCMNRGLIQSLGMLTRGHQHSASLSSPSNPQFPHTAGTPMDASPSCRLPTALGVPKLSPHTAARHSTDPARHWGHGRVGIPAAEGFESSVARLPFGMSLLH